MDQILVNVKLDLPESHQLLASVTQETSLMAATGSASHVAHSAPLVPLVQATVQPVIQEQVMTSQRQPAFVQHQNLLTPLMTSVRFVILFVQRVLEPLSTALVVLRLTL